MEFQEHFSLQRMNAESIDFNDTLFSMSYFYDLYSIKDSISKFGIINPPFLQKKENGKFRILSGFKRIKAYMEISKTKPDFIFFNAFITDKELNLFEMYKIFLSENAAIREFNILEKAFIANTLKNELNLSIEQIREINSVFSQYNNVWEDWFKKLVLLPQNIQAAYAKDELSNDLIDFFYDVLTLEEKNAFYDLITYLNLGKNKQKNFMKLLHDLSKIKNINYINYLDEIKNHPVLQNDSLTLQKKQENFIYSLMQERNPRLKMAEKNFSKWVSSLKISNEIKMEPSIMFEKPYFLVSFRFKNHTDYSKIVNDLKKIDSKDNFQALENDKLFNEN